MWNLEMAFHYPHDRFLLGWDYIQFDKEFNYNTVRLYLFIVTFTLNF